MMKKNMFKSALLMLLLIVSVAACKNSLAEGVNGFRDSMPLIDSDSIEEQGMLVSDQIPVPGGLTVSSGEYTDRIRVSWNQVLVYGKMIKYHVYRSADGVDYSRITGYTPIDDVYYEDTVSAGVKVGVNYFYVVKAVSMTENVTSRATEAVSGSTLGQIDYLSASFRNFTDKITVTWEALAGAKYYVVYRAPEMVVNVTPNDTAFVSVGSGVVGLTLNDYSRTAKGDLDYNQTYYYRVAAHFDDDVFTISSATSKGSLLTVGAPGILDVQSVSTGMFRDVIRIQWEKDNEASGYKLFRISIEEHEAGNMTGTELEMDDALLTVSADSVSYYDTDYSILSGTQYIYRIAAWNDFGPGQLSSLGQALEVRTSTGNGMADFSVEATSVAVTSLGYHISWPECIGANGYNLFRLDPQSVDLESAVASDWVLISEVITETSYLDDASGLDLSRDEACYKVMPINSDVVTCELIEDSLNPGIFIYQFTEKATFADIRTELDAIVDFDPVVGTSAYSIIGSDFTVPVPAITSAPVATQGTVESGVTLTGALDISELSTAQKMSKINIKVIRTCYYGDEKEVYPIAQPNVGTASPRISYIKEGIAPVANVVIYDLKSAIASDGTFSWNDPMPDFDENGNVSQEGMLWKYKHWDREAWKHILRKKPVEMARYFKVKYQVVAERSSDPAWAPETSSTIEGWPLLSAFEFAHLSHWMKDLVLNAMWHLDVPRYCWSQTINWLPGTQSHNGQSEGNASLKVSMLSGGGGTGGGYFADWPDFRIKVDNVALKVGMGDPAPKQVIFSGSVDTGMFDGDFNFEIYVRDWGPHWGLWAGGGNETKGAIKVKRSGIDSDWVSIVPNQVYLTGYPGNATYEIHGYNKRDANFTNVSGMTDTCWFTRINWHVRPVPVNTDIANGGKDGSIDYEMSPWE